MGSTDRDTTSRRSNAGCAATPHRASILVKRLAPLARAAVRRRVDGSHAFSATHAAAAARFSFSSPSSTAVPGAAPDPPQWAAADQVCAVVMVSDAQDQDQIITTYEIRLCSETCAYSADGDCDDGGEASDYSFCDLGTDCIDCGPRCAFRFCGVFAAAKSDPPFYY